MAHHPTQDKISKVPYDEIYERKFGRKIPFPKLEVEDIIVNPVNTDYFYVTKTQMLNSKINVYVTREDQENLENIIHSMKADHRYGDYDDSEIFDLALDRMRREKIFGLDADGNVKDEAKVSMQNRGTQGTKGLYGELGRKVTRPLGLANQDSSSEDEDEGMPEDSEDVSDEHTGEQQLQSESSEDSKAKESEEYSGGEEQSEDEASEPDNAEGDGEEESKLHPSPEIHDSDHHFGNTQSNGTASQDKTSKHNLAVAKNEGDLRKSQEHQIRPQLTSKGVTLNEVVLKEVVENKEKQNDDDVHEKDEEEKFTVEYVPFVKFKLAGKTNTFSSKARILMCCKFTPNGYTIESKIFAPYNDTDQETFKFSNEKYFSKCGKFFATILKNDYPFVIVYDAFSLKEKYSYNLDSWGDQESIATSDKIMLSEGATNLCVKIGNQYYVFDGKNGSRKIAIVAENGIVYSDFKNKRELIGRGFQQDENDVQTSVIYTIDVDSGRNESEPNIVKAFKDYYYSIVINKEGTACVMEKDNELYYYKFGDSDPKMILDGYEDLKIKNIDTYDVSVHYNEEYKSYFAIFEDGSLKYKTKMDFVSYGARDV